ncbi:undecaprenyl-diphosphatase [Marinospirillum insulare]|uniref:undecaprenyl-diphosphate phosphatase n=1 Tax=Marinospirillum insulare TaxID=217169 RepID=A0ABQ5ZZA6_9GAMM|nr:undecaprenyl-diphosphatase [Marinospirillum insulare]GLR63667.1 undecaprenyl-diphosphatase [Marinospirillum insulare]
MDNINRIFFQAINQYAGKSGILDASAIFIAEAMPYILIGIMLYLWFFSDQSKQRISFFAGYSVLIALLLSYIIGAAYFHPRPFVANLGTQLVEHAADASFPSDHTTFIFAISLMYWLNKPTRSLGGWLSCLSLIAGLARVFVGVHYPFDIAGAVLVGLVSSLMVIYLAKKVSYLEKVFKLFCCIKLPSSIKN